MRGSPAMMILSPSCPTTLSVVANPNGITLANRPVVVAVALLLEACPQPVFVPGVAVGPVAVAPAAVKLACGKHRCAQKRCQNGARCLLLHESVTSLRFL